MEAFESLKTNKAQGFDEAHVNVVNQMYNHIKEPLIRIFGDWIKLGAFPKKKITKVASIFKSREEFLANYIVTKLLLFLQRCWRALCITDFTNI